MKVTLLKGLFYQGETYDKGTIIEIADEKFAERLVEKGTATTDTDVTVETTPTAFEQARADQATLTARANAENAEQQAREQAVRDAEIAKQSESNTDNGGLQESAPLVPADGVQPTPEQIATTLSEAGLDASSGDNA